MRYELAGSGTTYLIFHSGKSESIISPVKKNLSRLWEIPARNQSGGIGYPDVFMLLCMIFNELIENHRGFLVERVLRLNNILDRIDTHIMENSRREKLKELIIDLNDIAQALDTHTFYLDQILKNMIALSKPHQLLETTSRSPGNNGNSFSLTESIERIRMLIDLDELELLYLKSRRETAMSLVCTTSPI